MEEHPPLHQLTWIHRGEDWTDPKCRELPHHLLRVKAGSQVYHRGVGLFDKGDEVYGDEGAGGAVHHSARRVTLLFLSRTLLNI